MRGFLSGSQRTITKSIYAGALFVWGRRAPSNTLGILKIHRFRIGVCILFSFSLCPLSFKWNEVGSVPEQDFYFQFPHGILNEPQWHFFFK